VGSDSSGVTVAVAGAYVIGTALMTGAPYGEYDAPGGGAAYAGPHPVLQVFPHGLQQLPQSQQQPANRREAAPAKINEIRFMSDILS
jgi:hypothetical protein